MQKSFHPLTPIKRNLSRLPLHDQHLLKELSPQLLTIGSSGCGKPKLEMLHSPISMNSDLFSLLLQSQRKMNHDEYFKNYDILQEDSYQPEDELNARQSTSEQDSDMAEDNEEEEDENDMRKRKRKSTAQIKILKKELEVVPNWGKEKIAEMSDITGLSQSQVYKWWWDQKKKNNKYERQNQNHLLDKKKLIKRPFSKRLSQLDDEPQNSDVEESQQVFTKPKHVIAIEEIPQTSKKVNKRLTFL